MTETHIPQFLVHGENAMAGHIGYAPGHPKNPYSALGLWYYVPLFTPEFLAETAYAAPVDRSAPYFGLSNVADYLRDLRNFGPKLDAFDQPILLSDGQPALNTLPGSGSISMEQIHGTFGWGRNLAAYRGGRWYLDNGAYGNFPTGAISFADFYGKRPDDPVVAGVWDQQAVGYHDFYTPVHRSIGIQRMGGGGAAGGYNGRGGNGEQTWAFPGGSPANGGQGGGYLYGNGINAFWTEQEYLGPGGSWGAPGNANNIAGNSGGNVNGTGYIYMFSTGVGGSSAWGGGGPSQNIAIGSGAAAGNNGAQFGGGGGGGMNNNGGGLYYWGDGGGGGGYTYDQFGQGVIGGVVNIYVAERGWGPIGGHGGSGRCYVAWS